MSTSCIASVDAIASYMCVKVVVYHSYVLMSLLVTFCDDVIISYKLYANVIVSYCA